VIGIYKITNLTNNKVYIGKSTNLELRWEVHKRQKAGNNSPHLYRSIRKYGISNFKFEILKLCPEKDLACLEQFFIRVYGSWKSEYGYNLTLGGDGGNTGTGFKGRHHSEESRKKLSEAKKGKYTKEKHPSWGKHLSKETKDKIRHGNLGKKMSDESKKKMKDARTGKKRPNISKAHKGRHWFNDDKSEIFSFECPETFKKGRLGRKVG
jgi:group I intron endonuclease